MGRFRELALVTYEGDWPGAQGRHALVLVGKELDLTDYEIADAARYTPENYTMHVVWLNGATDAEAQDVALGWVPTLFAQGETLGVSVRPITVTKKPV